METTYSVAKDGQELPKRDELLIELSVLLGQLDEGTYETFTNAGVKSDTKCAIAKTLYKNTINVVQRAIVFVRATQ